MVEDIVRNIIRDVEIEPAVIVEIMPQGSEASGRLDHSQSRDFGEGGVAVVPEQEIEWR